MTDTDLVASADENNSVTKKDVILDLGGGTGATIGGTGNLELDRDLIRRMRYQDKAVMLLLLAVYFLVLAFSASFAYRQSQNDSPIAFYTDPRYHNFQSEGGNLQSFLEAFTQAPKDVCLQISGFIPAPNGSVEWQGEYFFNAFSFSLDLSPWVVRMNGRDASMSTNGRDEVGLVDGVVAEDLDHVEYFINRSRNDLALLQVDREVAWPDWEELATNIKLRIRQSGFTGITTIHRTSCSDVTVYKNLAWANFMHSRVTKILCALSVLGWFIYLPYMWLRCSPTVVRSRYRVDISIEDYWNLIRDKLGSDGFVDESQVPRPIGANPGGIADEPGDIRYLHWYERPGM
jgi:hypothetical protein